MNPNKHLFYCSPFFCCLLQINAGQNSYPKTNAVWLPLVNIDWPKKRYGSYWETKADYLEILDTYKKLNYNAVIVQISKDAFILQS
jgi:uncharacterized lipoprotein YddW (UPF0748 family)